MADLVRRDEVEVMFVRAGDELPEIQQAWAALESRFESLRGRRFLGAFDGEYRACVALKEGDDPEALGLERGTVPGGTYLRERVRGEPPELYERIRPTFEALVRAAVPDPARPSLELYRRRDEIDLLLPVAT